MKIRPMFVGTTSGRGIDEGKKRLYFPLHARVANRFQLTRSAQPRDRKGDKWLTHAALNARTEKTTVL